MTMTDLLTYVNSVSGALSRTEGHDMTDGEAIQSFYLDGRMRNLRPKTLDGYGERLKLLAVYATGAGKRLTDITHADIRRYLLTIIDTNLSPYTINGRIRVFSVFYNFLQKEGDVPENPMAGIHLLKVDEKPKPILTPDQCVTFLNSFNSRRFEGSRNRNLALVLLDGMTRVGETLNLRLADLDLLDGVIHVTHTKSRRNRNVPISARTCKSLHSYIVRFRKLIPGDHVFCVADGRPMIQNRVNKIFCERSKRLGFTIYPHLLRHTGATSYCRQGGSLALLQRILGHSDIRTTQIYDHQNDEDVKRSHERFSPVAALTM